MSINTQVVEAVTSRAATDGDFRRRLMKNPNSAIAEVTGRAIPASVKLQVLERAPGFDAAILLPEFVDADAELSAEELETVAGGVAAWCDKICISQGTNITFAE